MCSRTRTPLSNRLVLFQPPPDLWVPPMEVEEEWLVEVEAMSTIVTRACGMRDRGMGTVAEHSHSITAPSMPLSCARVSLRNWPVIQPKAKADTSSMPLVEQEWLLRFI